MLANEARRALKHAKEGGYFEEAIERLKLALTDDERTAAFIEVRERAEALFVGHPDTLRRLVITPLTVNRMVKDVIIGIKRRLT